MGLKKAESQVKILLAETILAMCRNTLNNHAEVNVEGLLGITLDNDEIFLVSINQSITNPDVPSKTKKQTVEENDANNVSETSQRKRGKSKTNDDSSSESDDESTRDSKAKKRRRKRKRRQGSRSSNESASSSESDLNENYNTPSIPKVKNNENDLSENTNNFSVMHQEDTSLSNLSETVQIKQEMAEDEEEDIVIIKEEMADLPADNQFMNMQQQFESVVFPPDFSSSFPGTPQQSMSSDVSQPQPGPSSSNADEMQMNPLGSLMGMSNYPPKAMTADQLAYIERIQRHLATETSFGTDPNVSPLKKYLCPLCGKCFNSKGHLNYHLVSHTGNKNYQCEYCEKSYGLKHNLQRHMKQSHPEQSCANLSISIQPT